jgi:hypothetical protein
MVARMVVFEVVMSTTYRHDLLVFFGIKLDLYGGFWMLIMHVFNV